VLLQRGSGLEDNERLNGDDMGRLLR
jgi:hypothetical protein